MARTVNGAGRRSKVAAKADVAAPVVSKANGTPKVEKRKATEDASPVVIKKQKPVKEAAVEKEAPKKSALKKEKAAPKKAKKVEEPVVEETENTEEEEDEEVDADTQALVEALDSDNEEEQPTQISETFKKGQDVGKIPKSKKAKKEKETPASSGTPGVVYLGRIPHGFYEHELRSYFGQFGDISKLRVVRNKKTGASRHRAFIEFAEAEVADIAARTMDKYLLFGHILTAKVVPPNQVHPDLFKGANRRFKVIPWNKMAGNQLERPLSESQWQAKITKEEQRRLARAEKLKDLMDYDFDTPQLKAPEAKPQLENGTAEEAPKEIEAPPAAEEKVEEVVETVVETKVVTKVKKTKAAKEPKEETPKKELRSSKRIKKTKP